jgi:lipopolysaccharide/colanic/teichoic acid biosynthesis glycosyltransferase
MINESFGARRYARALRSIRRAPLFRRVGDRDAAEQKRRFADLVIAAVLLALTLPLMVVVAVAIKSESPGPVLDRQTCVGRSGRRFQMLKFRTIVHDPEHMMPAWAPTPTQIGQFLRCTRIEALPQLINVLRGEMSMIDEDGNSPSFFD